MQLLKILLVIECWLIGYLNRLLILILELVILIEKKIWYTDEELSINHLQYHFERLSYISFKKTNSSFIL